MRWNTRAPSRQFCRSKCSQSLGVRAASNATPFQVFSTEKLASEPSNKSIQHEAGPRSPKWP